MVGQSIEIWRLKDRSLRNALHCALAAERTPVTANWLYNNPDTQAYIYMASNDELGLDSWLTITGVDQIIKTGQIVLEIGGGDLDVLADPQCLVYVSNDVKVDK